MRQFAVVVVAQFFGRDTHTFMPFFARFLPVIVPFHLRAGPNEKLHFHLFKFAHAENELAGHYFVSEGLSNLGNTKGDFHPTGFLYVQEVYKNTLSGFGA